MVSKDEKRIPEQEGQYNDPREVEIYAENARKGIVAMTERLFVREIISMYGHHAELNILDVGTGPGFIPLQIAQQRPRWKITSLDASELMLKKAQNNWAGAGVTIESALAKADKMPFSSNQFDLVISHFAFHEFPDPVAVLKEIKRVLKPLCSVVIQDLSRPQGSLMSVLVWFATIAYGSIEMGRQYRTSLQASYRPEEMRALMLSAGLENPKKLRVPLGVGVLKFLADKPQNKET